MRRKDSLSMVGDQDCKEKLIAVHTTGEHCAFCLLLLMESVDEKNEWLESMRKAQKACEGRMKKEMGTAGLCISIPS